MIAYEVYKVVHILGIGMVLMAFGGLLFHQISNRSTPLPNKRLIMILHGIGLFLTLVAGFGLLARIGVMGSWPLWVWLKLVIWLVLGGGAAFLLRKPSLARFHIVMILLLLTVAAYLANYKPF